MAENLTGTETLTEARVPHSSGSDNNARGNGLSRRNVVRGAAWAVPVVALAAAAPALAASGDIPPNALEGFVELQWSCSSGATRLTIDGSGSHPNWGIWVSTTAGPPTYTAPTDGKIIFFFQVSTLVFTNASEPGWSNLVRSASDDEASIPGYYAYKTTYGGTWTFQNPSGTANDRWEANSDPKFTMQNAFYSNGCNPISAYARRTVTFNGATVTFRRGPVTVGN